MSIATTPEPLMKKNLVDPEDLPTTESMKRAHRVRRFRRSNQEHRSHHYRFTPKPWKGHNPMRSIA